MTGRRAFLRLSLPFFHDPVHGGEACQERPGGQRPLLLTQGFLSPLGLPDCAGPLGSDFTLGPAGIFLGRELWFRLF